MGSGANQLQVGNVTHVPPISYRQWLMNLQDIFAGGQRNSLPVSVLFPPSPLLIDVSSYKKQTYIKILICNSRFLAWCWLFYLSKLSNNLDKRYIFSFFLVPIKCMLYFNNVVTIFVLRIAMNNNFYH